MSELLREGLAVNPAIDVMFSGPVVNAPPRKNHWSLFVTMPSRSFRFEPEGSRGGVGHFPVLAPLPGIAVHVEEAQVVGT